MKRALLIFILLAVMAGAACAAATLDDVAKGVQQLQVSMGRLETRVDEGQTGLRNLVITLFGFMSALMTGLFYFVFDISRSLRVPKEERIAKLESFMEKAKDTLREMSEKLHMHKPIL